MRNLQDQEVNLPLVTYNSLYTILREEKRTKYLQELPKGFFISSKKFLNLKKKEAIEHKLQKKTAQLKKSKTLFTNSKKILSELITLRCSKISLIGITNTLHKEEVIEEHAILEEEKEFLQAIKKQVRNIQKKVEI